MLSPAPPQRGQMGRARDPRVLRRPRARHGAPCSLALDDGPLHADSARADLLRLLRACSWVPPRLQQTPQPAHIQTERSITNIYTASGPRNGSPSEPARGPSGGARQWKDGEGAFVFCARGEPQVGHPVSRQLNCTRGAVAYTFTCIGEWHASSAAAPARIAAARPPLRAAPPVKRTRRRL